MIEAIGAMPRYEEYKDSGVEWIGEIPAHWEVKRLKHLTGINSDSLSENMPKAFEIEYVDIGSVSYERGIEKTEIFSFLDSPSRARRLAKTGDTIISTVRTYLKAIDHVDSKKEKFVYSTGFAILRPTKCIDPKFLTSFVRSNAFTNQVEDESKGMSYPAINSTDLSNLFIAEPDLAEQTAIAAFLDHKTTQIDQAVTIKEKQIALLKERKQILIQNAVTRGLDPDAPMRDSGVEWIGEIPAHWKVKRIKHNARIKSGYAITNNELKDEGMYEVFGGNGFMGFADKFNVSGTNIIIGRVGAHCGNIRLSKEKKWISDNALVLSLKKDHNYLFFFFLLTGANLNNLNESNAQPLITGTKVMNFIVPVPSKEEQTAIVAHIQTQSTKIDKAISLQEQQIEKLKEYKATLINSAVTGKIKVA